MKFSGGWGKLCRERLYFEETDAKCLIGRRGNPKQPPKEYAVVDQGVSSALHLHVMVLAAGGICHSLKDAAVSLWWLQDPCCI